MLLYTTLNDESTKEVMRRECQISFSSSASTVTTPVRDGMVVTSQLGHRPNSKRIFLKHFPPQLFP